MDKTHDKAILNHTFRGSYKDYSKTSHHTHWRLFITFFFLFEEDKIKPNKSTKQFVIQKKKTEYIELVDLIIICHSEITVNAKILRI